MSNVETIKVVPARYPLRAAGAVVALFAGGRDPVRGL